MHRVVNTLESLWWLVVRQRGSQREVSGEVKIRGGQAQHYSQLLMVFSEDKTLGSHWPTRSALASHWLKGLTLCTNLSCDCSIVEVYVFIQLNWEPSGNSLPF